METLIRVNNDTGIANVASLQRQIASYRRTPINAEQGNTLFNEIETLINSFMPLYQVPVPIMINTKICNLQEHLRTSEENNEILQNCLIETETSIHDSETVISDFRQQLNDGRNISRGLATIRHTDIPVHTPTVKIPDPELYSGDKDTLRLFIVQLKLKTQTITNKEMRLSYAISRLSRPDFD